MRRRVVSNVGILLWPMAAVAPGGRKLWTTRTRGGAPVSASVGEIWSMMPLRILHTLQSCDTSHAPVLLAVLTSLFIHMHRTFGC